MTYTVFTGTPVVTVTDNRGLTVRTLDWNRTLPEQPLTLLVTRLTVADHALSGSAADPRLFRQGKTNLITFSTLAGQTARREHTDSGQLVTVFNAAGSPVWSRDPAGTVTLQRYDPLGRPESIRQQSGSVTRTSTGFVYGDNDPHTPTPQDHNLRGRCIRRYDEGGLLKTESVALCGVPLATSQQFFTDAAARPDWPQPFPLDSDLLEPRSWATTLRADALGRIICQTDAAGHRRLPGYDVSGRQTRQAVQLAGQPAAKPLLASMTWSAAGQVLTEASGNGVTTTYRYEPQTQRLQGIVARREHDGVVLQDLNYHYDRVGNVTSVVDNTTLPSWFCNQTTTGERRFGYDALSQLISATGREDATNGAQNSGLPSPKGMGAGEGRCVNYSRSYAYDDSGNLSSLQHLGAVSHTVAMVTDVASNRTVCRENGSQTPDDVAWDNWFTPAGQLRTLQSGGSTSPLQWDQSGWLHTVILIERSATEVTQNDREVYQYRAGIRVRKQTRRLVNSTTGVWRIDDVKYLDGLEIRDSWQETAGSSAAPTYREQLEVVTTPAGRQAIRILHWIMGQPAGLGNDQLRFSVDDNIGSASLELDEQGQVIGKEEYFPYGGTAVWSARSNVEADYKVIRYSGKERDGTGLYYYGYRYYAPWLCRWTAADPGFEIDGLNLFRMAHNNPVTLNDIDGLAPGSQRATELWQKAASVWLPPPDTTTIRKRIDKRYWGEQFRGVTYLDPEELSSRKVIFGDQVNEEGEVVNEEDILFSLHNGIKKEINTSSLEENPVKTWWGRPGWASFKDAPTLALQVSDFMHAYVIDLNGDMFTEAHATHYFHHSSFKSGAPVKDAGMINILNGVVIGMSNKSGHYMPLLEQKVFLLKKLYDRIPASRENGLGALGHLVVQDASTFKYYSAEKLLSAFTGNKYMDPQTRTAQSVDTIAEAEVSVEQAATMIRNRYKNYYVPYAQAKNYPLPEL
ncbi:RHS repeat-associated core domain-containing protein [Nissabacter sp. SGAir0207]|uniref:RHS repeat-associated core domain-containing protein n=1 Tax=Nissabacter sp. SGAir0207 TaxID=2126321 RepID=UPI0010CCC932|nr:RHS repeat-associated core domain-containing protein [Nissabacter sp. SGAir0207]QCR35052.1 hypothetical protein C1N62_02600 [Nissabacter sp. SGAir0207]